MVDSRRKIRAQANPPIVFFDNNDRGCPTRRLNTLDNILRLQAFEFVLQWFIYGKWNLATLYLDGANVLREIKLCLETLIRA